LLQPGLILPRLSLRVGLHSSIRVWKVAALFFFEKKKKEKEGWEVCGQMVKDGLKRRVLRCVGKGTQ